MEKILEPLLNSPKLKDYVAELQDYLSSEEAKRIFFYDKVSDHEKAEFINGEIIIHSPVLLKHNLVLKYLLYAIDGYVSHNGLGLVGYEKLLIKLTRNDYEPDLCFFGKGKADGFAPDQKLFPAADWIAEVLSQSTEKNDRGIKMEDYALHGVQEYWLVDPDKKYIEQYYLKHEAFFLHKIYSEGEIIQSNILKGLELPVDAVFSEDKNKAYRKQFF